MMQPTQRLSLTEFTALSAMLFAIVAFSIDAMLPAMGQIGTELSPHAPHRALEIITSFVFGMGVGTFFSGPLSDAFGRKPVIVAGALLYCAAAALAWVSQSFEVVMFARFLQGLGASGPRIAATAIIRDLYSGRQMARVMSLAMMIFTIVPAIAPLIGSWIMALSGWRGIFPAFILFVGLAVTWLVVRQPETLAKEDRRAIRIGPIWEGCVELAKIPRFTWSIGILSLAFTMIFFMISTAQQVFDISFGRAESFPWWFALVSILSAPGAYVNSRLVPIFGMRKVCVSALWVQVGVSIVALSILYFATPGSDTVFVMFICWMLGVFLVAGSFTIGNITSLAMEPVGHIAGLASSVLSAFATVISAQLAVFAGIFFDSTPLAPLVAILLCALLSVIIIQRIRD